jgi:hypothetical protein
MDHSFHSACLLFPRLSDDELQALADDIRHNGLLNPIVTLDGQILDGRNRLAACKIAGVQPRFVEWDGKDRRWPGWSPRTSCGVI